MTSHSKETYSQLLHKLQQQTKWYKTLLQLSENEAVALQNADNQQLQRISQDTRKAQTRIEQLNQQIEKLLDSGEDGGIAEKDQRIRKLRKGIQNLLTTLVKRNVENVTVVQGELEQLRDKLEHLTIAEKISKGYCKLPIADSKFLDRTN